MKSVRLPVLLVILIHSVSLISAEYKGIFQTGSFAAEPDTIKESRYWIKVKPFDLSVIPPSSGVHFYKDGIIFLSSSRDQTGVPERHASFGRPRINFAVLKDTLLENTRVFSSSITYPLPAEAVTFSSDNRTMYFTMYSKPDGLERIFRAVKSGSGEDDDSWTVDKDPVAFCTDKSTYSHPSLSADGKLMVFVSNRQGTVGGMDLWASLLKDNKWTDPVNLGDAVNSTFDELFPYLDEENNLYFSSNNPQGFGGHDIYVCKFKGKTWEKPINLSVPVNTRLDDIAFSISRHDGKSAFYTVKEAGGKKMASLHQVMMDPGRPDTLLTLAQYFTRPDISQMVILALEPAVQATDAVSETAVGAITDKDVITYRVQFMTSFNPRTRPQITVAGQDYSVFEYLFSGAYRLCVGEFSVLSPAIELQNLLRRNGYPGATVLAFRNNVISFDPELLKVTGAPSQAPVIEEKKPATETVVAAPPVKEAAAARKETAPPEVKKTETAKETVTPPATVKPEPAKTTVPAVTAPAQTPTAATEKKDVVVYRVQIATASTSKGSYKLTIGTKSYDTFEYNYAGAFRTCVGEFSTLAQATELQKICRASGYPQAFVVAFKNNVRSTDPALFK